MKALFVCTANICRSRMGEEVFRVLTWQVRDKNGARPRHEVRSAGTRPDPGGRGLTKADVEWADVIVVMETEHETYIRRYWPLEGWKIRVLGIPDIYQPGDPLLREQLAAHVRTLLAGVGS
jgi:protein-tyrosine-phosphatase